MQHQWQLYIQIQPSGKFYKKKKGEKKEKKKNKKK